jgi:hypothetical protein
MNRLSRAGKTFATLQIAISTARQGRKVVICVESQARLATYQEMGHAMADDFDELPIEIKFPSPKAKSSAQLH